MNWHIERLGIKPENLVWYQHEKLAHYADAAFDIKYKFHSAQRKSRAFTRAPISTCADIKSTQAKT